MARDILISIQNDREWRVLAEKVLGDAALGTDAKFATNVERVKRRDRRPMAEVAAVFAATDVDAADEKACRALTSPSRVINDSALLGEASAFAPHHGRLAERARLLCRRRRRFTPAMTRSYGPIPALGEHTDAMRKEFLPT